MSYAKVIVNMTAGAGKAAKMWPHINSYLKNIGLLFEHDVTEAPGHALELARSAAGNGYEMIVSVGGDGTINEIVNGLYESGNIQDVRLGIISIGTGSDYVRTVGLPCYFKEASHVLKNKNKRLVDLGLVEYKYHKQIKKRLFVNCAGLGFDTEIVKATERRFKNLGGRLSYLSGLLTTFLSYRNKDLSITIDGKKEYRKVCTIVVNNGKYAGGGMMVAPQAEITDGFFDVLIIDDIKKFDLLRSIPRIYKGTHVTHPKVTMKRVREITIESSDAISLQADGEVLGEAPASFRVLPDKLNIAT